MGNTYSQDAINSGWRDNGDGTLTSPDGGTTIRPDNSPEANARYASTNAAAANALAGTKGSTDPYAMSNYEKAHDPNFSQDFGEATKGWYTNPDTGNFENKPESFLSKYGPWLALAGAGGVMAAPYIMGAFGAGAGGTGAAGGATEAAAGTLPSTTIGTGMASGLPGLSSGASMAAEAGTAATGGGGSITDTLIHNLMSKNGLDNIANVASSFGKTAANNRGSQLNAGMDIDKLMLAQQQQQRAAETDALKKLSQTSYIMGGGNPYHPTSIPGLGTLPDFGFGPKAPTAAEVQGASTLQKTIQDRLANPQQGVNPQDLQHLTTPSTGERISDWVSPISKLASMFPFGK